jgi:hypothetical protein
MVRVGLTAHEAEAEEGESRLLDRGTRPATPCHRLALPSRYCPATVLAVISSIDPPLQGQDFCVVSPGQRFFALCLVSGAKWVLCLGLVLEYVLGIQNTESRILRPRLDQKDFGFRL